MKKIIFSIIATFSLLVSSITSASVSQNDAAFLFADSNITVAEITTHEMLTTEGQVFGLTLETTTKYLTQAFDLIKPYASNFFNLIKDKAIAAIKARFDGFLGNRPTPTLTNDGFGPAV